ncbi:MAG: hypothetical protein LJE62_07375 [Silicimonas sp.]|nr:hypothetical protein [Silicimonas sp.]
MGRIVLMSSCAFVMAFAFGLAIKTERNSQVRQVAQQDVTVEAGTGPFVELQTGSAGSALATAAFGLSALQPETYNGEVVLDIIEASPLEYAEKDRLTAMLMSAEAGQGELPEVLEDIRISLAIE